MAIYQDWATRMVVESIKSRNFKAALLASYSQEFEHTVWADVMGFEAFGSGYSSGGKVALLDVIAVPQVGIVDISCAPISYGLLGVPAINAVVFYDDTGNPLTSRLLAADVFEAGIEVAGTDFTYIPTEGTLLSLSIADEVFEP